MATYTATTAGSTYPVAGHGLAGNKKVKTGTITLSANLAPNDTVQLVRVPAGAVIVGGKLFGQKLESTTSGATLDIDIGWEANGTDAADSDGLGNLGVLSAAAVAGYKPEAGYLYQFGGVLLTTGPQALAAETVIQLTCVASAASFSTGTINLAVEYYVP